MMKTLSADKFCRYTAERRNICANLSSRMYALSDTKIGRYTDLSQPEDGQVITIDKKLGEGETTVFQFRDAAGLPSEGLVIRYGGRLHAFKNLCRHQPLSLDYGDGDFLTEDGRYLLCRNHGALFEPDTGLCVSGPCSGASLFVYPVEEAGDKITVRIPEQIIDLD
jgi:nitrite reductase/ring-hydroxylating ferredoxin subunit